MMLVPHVCCLSCSEFDKDHIHPKTLERIQTYTSLPELQLENIGKVPSNPTSSQRATQLLLPGSRAGHPACMQI